MDLGCGVEARRAEPDPRTVGELQECLERQIVAAGAHPVASELDVGCGHGEMLRGESNEPLANGACSRLRCHVRIAKEVAECRVGLVDQRLLLALR